MRARPIFAGILGVLAVVGVLLSTLGLWAQSVLFDSTKVAGAVGDALDDPVVVDALAVYVTHQVFVAVDVEGRVAETLPGPLSALAPTVTSTAERAVSAQVEKALSRDETQALITGIIERAHARALRLLEGDGLVDGISVSDGQVVVNTLPLFPRGFEALQGIGLLESVDLPEITVDGDPAAQIAELEQLLGRDLPDDLGQLVVYESDSVAQAEATVANAQRIVSLVKRAIVEIVVLTVILLAASVLVARRRKRAALWLGLGSAAALVIARALVRRLVDNAPELVTDPAAREAVRHTVTALTSSLVTLATLVILIGAAVAAWAWFTGGSRTAAAASAAIDRRRAPLSIAAFIGAGVALMIGGLEPLPVVIAFALVAAGFALRDPARIDTAYDTATP